MNVELAAERRVVDDLDGERVDCPRDGFDAALAEHQAELLQYLARRTGDRDAAADLSQDTFSRMMKYRHADVIDDYKRMLFRIANNLVLEYHRAARTTSPPFLAPDSNGNGG